MPVITASKTKPTYDAVIVGSGAAGGQAAYALTLAGANTMTGGVTLSAMPARTR